MTFPRRNAQGRPPAPNPGGGSLSPYLGQSLLPATEGTSTTATLASAATLSSTAGASRDFTFQPQDGAFWIERIIGTAYQGATDGTGGLTGLASIEFNFKIGGQPVFAADRYAPGGPLAHNAIDAEIAVGRWIDPVVTAVLEARNQSTTVTYFRPVTLGQYARGVAGAKGAQDQFGFGGFTGQGGSY